EENLGHRLRCLNFAALAFVHGAAPFDAVGKPLAAAPCGGTHQLMDKSIVGFVFVESRIQPAGDLLAAPVNETGPVVSVAEQVIPEGEPVSGIGLAIIKQTIDEPGPLVAARVSLEFSQCGPRGRKSDQIKRSAAGKGTVGNDISAGLIALHKIV